MLINLIYYIGIIFVILISLVHQSEGIAFADPIDINQRTEMVLSHDYKSRQRLELGFSTNKTFNNIDDVALLLTKMTKLRFVIASHSAIQMNGITINEYNISGKNLLDQMCDYFGYKWHIQDGIIVIASTHALSNTNEILDQSIINNYDYIASAKVIASNLSKKWYVNINDHTVSGVFQQWAQSAGYQMVYKSKNDFLISANAVVQGTFKDAVDNILQSIVGSTHPLKAIWYSNKVFVIEDM